jgi:hypothetical protein
VDNVQTFVPEIVMEIVLWDAEEDVSIHVIEISLNLNSMRWSKF